MKNNNHRKNNRQRHAFPFEGGRITPFEAVDLTDMLPDLSMPNVTGYVTLRREEYDALIAMSTLYGMIRDMLRTNRYVQEKELRQFLGIAEPKEA